MTGYIFATIELNYVEETINMILSTIACISAIVFQSVVNDDRDVIQAAMLSFFTPEEWHSADWTPKNHVIIRTQLRSKVRPQFGENLDAIIKYKESEVDYLKTEMGKANPNTDWDKAKMKQYLANITADLEKLKAIQALTGAGAEYTPPPITPLKSMDWDKRIIVTDERNLRFPRGEKNDSKLERYTVYASLERPCYSPNGRYAIVSMSLPWSIHSADVSFVFERKETGWEKIAVNSVFFV